MCKDIIGEFAIWSKDASKELDKKNGLNKNKAITQVIQNHQATPCKQK